MPKRKVEFFIVDILVSLDIIKRKTENIDYSDQLLQDEDIWLIVTRSLEIIGKAMKYILEVQTLSKYIKPEWRNIVDLRNIVAHEYFGINVDLIFNVIQKDIPELEIDLISFIKSYPNANAINFAIDQAIQDLESSGREESMDYLQTIKKQLT